MDENERRCDCESEFCHPDCDCQNKAEVLTIYSKICKDCAEKMPDEYLV